MEVSPNQMQGMNPVDNPRKDESTQQ